MNSKEALEELQCVLVSNQATKRYSDIFEENLLRPIEKDLEVLEIWKRKSVDISLIKDIMLDKIKFDYYPYDNLTNEEFNKIKEWLEDE